ncbi:DUF3237 family protein [Gorillibacterium sp. CAU 1737]|uniref:DUF3237 family protein n=1 Tax=Gorillibacterium sp. CAU 1737 TaxID=3140362 RepID=UPI0032614E92
MREERFTQERGGTAMEWEEALTVHVTIGHTSELRNSDGDSVVMISFGGRATGKYFEGDVLESGVDTQIIGASGGHHSLSARYMLRGQDYTGQDCELYIENNGRVPRHSEGPLFRTTPRVITNSRALSFLNDALLAGEGIPTESGVDIKIYRAL